MRTPSTGREIIIEAEPDQIYLDRETGEELEVVAPVLPLAPTPSELPWTVDNLRFCNWCDQLGPEGSQRLPGTAAGAWSLSPPEGLVTSAASKRGTGSEAVSRPGARRSRSAVAIALAIVAGFGLAACGGGGTGTADTSGAPQFSVPNTPPAVAANTATTSSSSSSSSTSGTGTSASGSTSPSSGATTPSSGATTPASTTPSGGTPTTQTSGGGGTGAGGGGGGGGGGGTGTSGGAGLDSSFCLQNPATC